MSHHHHSSLQIISPPALDFAHIYTVGILCLKE
uniref:Uncharacterized protein n=1 Tax=Anguilla anguilla TaxID=7936 RepID=A0A0E9T6S5_ANGAN